MASWDELLFLAFFAAAVIGLALIILCRNDYKRIAESQGGSFFSITKEIAKKRPVVGYSILALHSFLLLFALVFFFLRFFGPR